MATYYEQLNKIADLYFARFAKAVPAKEIMAWAIQEGLYRPTPNLVLQKAAEDLARALREDVFTDPQGRHVRAKMQPESLKTASRQPSGRTTLLHRHSTSPCR